MLELENKKKNLKILTLFFLFLLPFSGVYFFHNRITTLIIVSFVLLIFFLTILFYKDSRKNLKYLLLYYLVIFLYLLISYWRSGNFVSLIPNQYSVISEALTMLKLVMPITFLYAQYYQKLTKEEYFKVVKLWIILIAGSILITNIFKVSLSSYSDNFIKYNIFEWNKNLYYVDTASRGFFTYGNQAATILIMLLLMSVYLVISGKKRNIFYVIIIAISMLMLGTRVAALGGLLTLICAIGFYFFMIFLKKEKFKKNVFLLAIPLVMWVLLLPISPFFNRNLELNQENDEMFVNSNLIDDALVNQNYDNAVIGDYSEKVSFVINNYNPDYLPEFFFNDYYPISYDEDFWYQFVKNNKQEDLNYRFIEKSIIKRMWEIDDKWTNVLWGISNTRIQNVVNLENDFILHYYAFGIIGSIILLLFYILVCCYALYKFFREQTYWRFITVTCVLLFIFCALLTGNIINSCFPIICFTFVSSGVFIGKKVDNG